MLPHADPKLRKIELHTPTPIRTTRAKVVLQPKHVQIVTFQQHSNARTTQPCISATVTSWVVEAALLAAVLRAWASRRKV